MWGIAPFLKKIFLMNACLVISIFRTSCVVCELNYSRCPFEIPLQITTCGNLWIGKSI